MHRAFIVAAVSVGVGKGRGRILVPFILGTFHFCSNYQSSKYVQLHAQKVSSHLSFVGDSVLLAAEPQSPAVPNSQTLLTALIPLRLTSWRAQEGADCQDLSEPPGSSASAPTPAPIVPS